MTFTITEEVKGGTGKTHKNLKLLRCKTVPKALTRFGIEWVREDSEPGSNPDSCLLSHVALSKSYRFPGVS